MIPQYLLGPDPFGLQGHPWQTAEVEQPPFETPSAAEEAGFSQYSTFVPRKMPPVWSLLTPLPPPHCQRSYVQSSPGTGVLVDLMVLSAAGQGRQWEALSSASYSLPSSGLAQFESWTLLKHFCNGGWGGPSV